MRTDEDPVAVIVCPGLGTTPAMLSVLLGLSLSSLLVWSGPPTLPDRPISIPAQGAGATNGAEPTPPARSDAPSNVVPVQPVQPQPVQPQPDRSVPPQPAPPQPEASPPAQPSPTTASVDPAGADPFTHASSEDSSIAGTDTEQPPGLHASHRSLDDYVAVRPPAWRGTGMLVAAGVVFAHAITFQGLDSLMFGNVATGGIERALMATTVGLAAGGGAVRARADAYDDTALGRKRPGTRRALIAGAVLTGVGAVMGLVNEGLWWRCVYDGSGPYRTDGNDFNFSTFDCRYGISRGLLDLSTGATSAGLAMMTWALVYRRNARAYQRARVVGLRPSIGRDRFGLSLGGRF